MLRLPDKQGRTNVIWGRPQMHGIPVVSTFSYKPSEKLQNLKLTTVRTIAIDFQKGNIQTGWYVSGPGKEAQSA